MLTQILFHTSWFSEMRKLQPASITQCKTWLGNVKDLLHNTKEPTLTTICHKVASTSRAARGGGGSFKNIKPIGKIRCCESRNVFVGGNSKTATAVKNLDAIAKCEAHDYCFANCFQTCQKGPFSVDFTVCSNLGIWPRSKTCTSCSTFQLTNGLVD